jgi:hypothetical protein
VNNQLSNFEQTIYNTYLKISRQALNKPYTIRKKFDNFPDEKYILIKKISSVLQNNKHIVIEDFFKAPYEVYKEDTDVFDLNFYISQRAFKAYSTFIKKINDLDIDCIEILERVKSSLLYIKNYCIDHKLTYQQYINEINGQLPLFVSHIKEHKIVIYTIFGDEQLEQIMKRVESPVLTFIFGNDIYKHIDQYRTKFYTSKKCKILIREGLKKVKKMVDICK